MPGIHSKSAPSGRRCRICGDEANGHHYSVLSCEGCKAFFKRSVGLMRKRPGTGVYKRCNNQNQCTIDMYWRRMCRSCRYNKCICVGMLPEYVSETSSRERNPAAQRAELVAPVSPIPIEPTPTALNFSDKCAIQNLLTLLDKYKSTKEAVEALFPKSEQGQGHNVSSLSCETILALTELAVKHVVQFANDLPGFGDISLDVKLKILKACSIELLMIRASRRYNPEQGRVMFANGMLWSREDYVNAGIVLTAEPLFNFWHSLSYLKLDDCEYALLSALIVFSKRPELGQLGVRFLEEMYENCLQLLVRYEEFRCSQSGPEVGTSGVRLAKLVAAMTELRGLGLLNESDCYDLVFSGKEIPDLLLEAYDPKIEQLAKLYKDLDNLEPSTHEECND